MCKCNWFLLTRSGLNSFGTPWQQTLYLSVLRVLVYFTYIKIKLSSHGIAIGIHKNPMNPKNPTKFLKSIKVFKVSFILMSLYNSRFLLKRKRLRRCKLLCFKYMNFIPEYWDQWKYIRIFVHKLRLLSLIIKKEKKVSTL